MTDAADAALAEQYESYPYPQRDPRDEARRLIVGSPSHLREVDHWIFAGRRPAVAPLRALVAGGGSGDATVMLAQQMTTAGRAGDVTWLDRSGSARKIAEARVAARNLGNVIFREASILDLPGSGLGPFDYIDCCGVLHHLPDPLDGLRALVSVLAPGGGLGLMVYAPHGRTGVYMMQDALRLLAPPGEAPPQRVDIAKRLWRQMPETAWLRRNPWITDHVKGGDAGIYDLLLNPRDVAFTVPALAALIDAAGLEIRCLVEPFRYDPDSFLSDPRLRERTARLSFIERAALAEAAAGNMGIHVAYCVRKGEAPPPPAWDDPDSIPILRELEGPKLAAQIPRDGVLRVSADGLTVPITLPRLGSAIVARIDGTRTMGDIRDELTELGIAPDAFARDYAATAAALERVNRMLLKAR
ncbi:class I SAM-dependent methyltransferase [Roseomonas sp. JC162]|uniref:Class I SAM-dependent methyltransferase n=1 Tax=Neoroseomonas marina TaxID=1232220 RepID=A0A848ED39_9PROT|nr:class I SAM-dependent methyltransferase [Neoroseomonas marina]NMJ41218.1 class I SAM-dependent methyltransferase [Neoroseomonas marina]